MGGVGQVRRRVEAVERLGANAAGHRHGEDFAGQRDVEPAVLWPRQGVGDRIVGEGRGEEHRAVGFLAPEVAPDVRGRLGAALEVPPRVADGEHARRDALCAERLADLHGPTAAVKDYPRLQVVGAEVHERADGPRLAGEGGNGQLVEPVLRRDHAPGGGQVGEQRAGGSRGVLRLGREDDGVPRAGQAVGRSGGQTGRELGDRAGDAEAVRVDRINVVGYGVY